VIEAIAPAASPADRRRGQFENSPSLSRRGGRRGFEQSQEQMIRVSADRDRLTVIVANEFACTDERFGDAFNGPRRRASAFEPIGGDILCFLPGGGETPGLSSGVRRHEFGYCRRPRLQLSRCQCWRGACRKHPWRILVSFNLFISQTS